MLGPDGWSMLQVGSRVRFTAEFFLKLEGVVGEGPVLEEARKLRGEVVSVVALEGGGLVRVRWDGEEPHEMTVIYGFLQLEG